MPLPKLKRNCKYPWTRFSEIKSPLPFFICPLYRINPLFALAKKKTSIENVFPTPSNLGNCTKLEPKNSGVEPTGRVSKISHDDPERPGGHLQTNSPGPVGSHTEPLPQGLEKQGLTEFSQNSPVNWASHSHRKDSISGDSHVPPFLHGTLEHGFEPHSWMPSILSTVSSFISWKSTDRLLIFSLRMHPRRPFFVPMFSYTL